jgi:hypothetical protein
MSEKCDECMYGPYNADEEPCGYCYEYGEFMPKPEIQRIRDLEAECAALRKVAEAGAELVADVKRRYPGEEFRCQIMRKMDERLRAAGWEV